MQYPELVERWEKWWTEAICRGSGGIVPQENFEIEGSSAKTTSVTFDEMLNSPKGYEEIMRIR